jgi:membrane protease YdiL (CAAX protease family)
MLLGEILIGEEGQSVWRIYSSPISAKNLVKSKYFFMSFFSIIIVLISGALGIFLYRTAWTISIAIFLESLFLVMAVGAVALAIGFKGPDFSQSRRTRMVRQEWSLIGLVVCGIVGLAVLAPLIFSVGLALLLGGAIVLSNLAISVVVSAAISLAISLVAYRINIGLAEEFLRKAEI